MPPWSSSPRRRSSVTTILGIAGSLRAASLHRDLLGLAAEELPAGVFFELWDGLGAIPPYDADDESPPPAVVQDLVEAIGRADGVVFASPEYNGSVPGVLKNAIDWVSRQGVGAPLRGKPVAVIGGSPGQFGGVWAHAELRKVLGVAGASVVEVELSVPRLDQRLAEPDDDLRGGVRAALGALAGVHVPA